MDSFSITRFFDWIIGMVSGFGDRVMDVLQCNVPMYIQSNGASVSDIDRAILDKLNDISSYGIGFSDVVSAIAFPLIIALFAFSFPFIFQIINDINNKYDSKQLSKLFASSWQYVFFWVCNVMSICYLLIYGITELITPKVDFTIFAVIGDWLSISLASVYAISVLLFVWHCVAFNNPNRLITIVKKRYMFELWANKLRDNRLFVKYYVRCLLRSKGKGGKTIYYAAQKMVSYLSTNAPHEHYVNLLIEITHYSIRRKDKEVFNNVLSSMDKIINEEKYPINVTDKFDKSQYRILDSKPHYKTMRFFEDLAGIYTPSSNDFMVEEIIVTKLLGSFNKSMYMNYADSFKLALCLSNLIDGNNYTLLEKYIDTSRFYFSYIKRLPDVLYVKGGDAAERPKTEENAQRSWDELCDYHYLVFAYAFAGGHYSLLSALLDKNSHKQIDLYPKKSTDVLIRYTHCRNNLIHFPLDELFRRRVDAEDMLNKYTVALLLILGDDDYEPHKVSEFVTKAVIEDIEYYSKDLLNEINSVKQKSKLTELYPQIKNTDYEKVYATCHENITSIVNPVLYEEEVKEDEKSKQKSSRLGRIEELIVDAFSKRKREAENKELEKIRIDVYKSSLDANLMQEFKDRMKRLMSDVSKYVPMELFNDEKKEKDSKIALKKCTIRIPKIYFTYQEFSANRNAVYNTFVELTAARLSYITLSVFRNMTVRDVYKTPSDFNLFFESYTKGHSEDFILINVDSRFSSLLNIEFKNRSRYYLGKVPFITLNCISWLSLMTDLEDYEYFNGSLIIIEKKDLPMIADINETETFDVDYTDISDKQQMILDARISADTGKKLIYNKKANIVKVAFKPLAV